MGILTYKELLLQFYNVLFRLQAAIKICGGRRKKEGLFRQNQGKYIYFLTGTRNLVFLFLLKIVSSLRQDFSCRIFYKKRNVSPASGIAKPQLEVPMCSCLLQNSG